MKTYQIPELQISLVSDIDIIATSGLTSSVEGKGDSVSIDSILNLK